MIFGVPLAVLAILGERPCANGDTHEGEKDRNDCGTHTHEGTPLNA